MTPTSGAGSPPGALLPADPPVIGGYRTLGRLGGGGMGLVYLAEAPGRGPVAVKVIRPEYADDPDYRRRFRREATAASRVHDPGVARVVDADPDAPTPYLVTEYVPGPSLRERVLDHGPLQGAELDAFAVGVARALAAVHAAGVVHRDLKPANVILAPQGPRLVDFGIARPEDAATRYTGTGDIIGSIGWMAPEALRQEEVTPAADVFAWASLVTFAGTGRRPFGTGPDAVIAHRLLAGPPADLTGLPAHLAAAVRAAFAPDPAARPTAAALASALDGSSDPTRLLLGPEPTRVAPAAPAPSAWQQQEPAPAGWSPSAPPSYGTPPGRGAASGRRRRPSRRALLVGGGGVLAVGALLGALNGAKPSKPSATPIVSSAPSASPAKQRRPTAKPPAPGTLIAAAVPAADDTDVRFTLTQLRCDLRTVGQGATAYDPPAGKRACIAYVTARNTGTNRRILPPQWLHDADGNPYGSNGGLSGRLNRPRLELHGLDPGATLRSALVWELPAGVRPVDVEFHGDLLTLGTRRTLPGA